MTNILPALLAGLTALVTSGLVHVGYAAWWLSQVLTRNPAPFDWTGALALSGTLSAVVLIGGLVVRRMVAIDAPSETAVRVPVRSEAVRQA